MTGSLRVAQSAGLRGVLSVPGDKSISHRAVILGGLAHGETAIHGFLTGEDCEHTLAAIAALGVPVRRPAATEVTLQGAGPAAFHPPGAPLDFGNSGTGMRLMLGVLAGLPFPSQVTGDDSLSRRPMRRVVDPVRRMGAEITGREDGNYAPLSLQGRRLRGITYASPVASAQVKSCLLLAGLLAEGTTTIREPALSRDHSERMLAAFGARVERGDRQVTIEGGPALRGQDITVPGDFSSAAFFLVAAAIVPGSEVTVRGVGVNPTRTGLLDILGAMGADLSLRNLRTVSGEPCADLTVRHRPLRGTTIAGDLVVAAIDELPILAVAAAAAEGDTEVRDARELRVKETDRLATCALELQRLGADITETAGGWMIRGGRPLVGSACAHSHGDHRLAMALAVAGLIAAGETTVNDAACIATSSPGFAERFTQLGASLEGG